MKRVLVVTPWSGGFVDYQLTLLSDAGLDLEIVRLTQLRGPRIWVALCAILQGIFCRAAVPDVVHAYGAWPAGITAATIAWSMNRPLVVHEHLSPPEDLLKKPLALKVLERADRVLSPSQSHANRVSTLAGGRHVAVVANPVPEQVHTFFPGEARRRIVCIGRMEPQKGFDRVARASRLLPGYDFHFIGTGSQLAGVQHLAGPNAFFHNAVGHARALKWLAAADVVVCPSRHESFGLIAAEAAAFGVPVIATDVGIHAQVSAVLVPHYAADKLWANAIREAASLPRVKRRVKDSEPETFVSSMQRAYTFETAGGME